MKHTLFKIVYLMSGLMSCAFLAYAGHPTVFAMETVDKMTRNHLEYDIRAIDTHLYNDCRVLDFRPCGLDPGEDGERRAIIGQDVREHAVNDADVLFFGDSFIKSFWGKEFEGRTGTPAYSHRVLTPDESPLYVFDECGLDARSKARYLVIECAERGIVDMYSGARLRTARPPAARMDFNVWFRDNILTDEKDLEFILSKRLTAPLTYRNTLLFRVFRYISNITPVYSLEPPMLFHAAEVNFNRSTATLKSAAEVAGVVAAIGEEMKRRHGITVIFMPVPNKLSIYGGFAGMRYNGFLPELYKQLDKEGVVYIDLYHDFASSGEILYHPGGTHWNFAGSDIAMGKLIGLCREMDSKHNHGRH